jgi:predicted TIM-barrel fold metal-dependent hydrolase
MLDGEHGPGPGRLRRIADAHHHLWDLGLNTYPWLLGSPQDPHDVTGIGLLQHNYLVADLRADTAGLPLRASVHVEAAHDPADPVRETSWLQSQSDAEGLPNAIVAAAVLEAPNVEALLERHLEHRAVRGIRQMLDRNPRTGASEESVLMDDPAWRRGLGLLAGRGLSFDLQVLPSQLATAARLAADFPDLVFVLNHGGYHVPASLESEQQWRDGIAQLAGVPNVVVKASGYDIVDPHWRVQGYRDYVTTLLDTFGVDRVLFGSNFPVDGRTTTYRGLINATIAATSALTAEELDRFFFANTVKIYRLELATQDTMQSATSRDNDPLSPGGCT